MLPVLAPLVCVSAVLAQRTRCQAAAGLAAGTDPAHLPPRPTRKASLRVVVLEA